MEFRFNVNPYFKDDIIRVDQNLMPIGFKGDRRQAQEASTKLVEIINTLGEASARAQGLNKAVTSALKLRNSDHSVYLMREDAGKNGSVVGLLKVGTKNLYIFNPNGETKQVSAPCVLDFYVHESRQRAGLGKTLFETMLAEQKYHPSKMAIDRPSKKLLGFLSKHYNLKETIPQMNNFVVYNGFFDNGQTDQADSVSERKVNITNSPNTALFGPHTVSGERRSQGQLSNGSPGLSQMPGFQTSPNGRFGAPRPLCSMSEYEPEKNVNFSEAQACAPLEAIKEEGAASAEPNLQAYPPNTSMYNPNTNIFYPPHVHGNIIYPQPYAAQPYFSAANAALWNSNYYYPNQIQYQPNSSSAKVEADNAQSNQYTQDGQEPAAADHLKSPESGAVETPRLSPTTPAIYPYSKPNNQWPVQPYVYPMMPPVCGSCSSLLKAHEMMDPTRMSHAFNPQIPQWPGYVCPPILPSVPTYGANSNIVKPPDALNVDTPRVVHSTPGIPTYNHPAVQWPHHGYNMCPMVQSVPVCRSCSNVMFPTWNCPNGHTEGANYTLPPSSVADTNASPPLTNTPIVHDQKEPASEVVAQNEGVEDRNAAVPNPGMVPDQSNWNQPQIIECPHPSHYPQSQDGQQSNANENSINQTSIRPDQAPPPAHSAQCEAAQMHPTLTQTQSVQLYQTQPLTPQHTPRQTYTIQSSRQPAPDAIIRNSMEQMTLKSESQQRFHREFENSLKSGVYSRRSNGLDPGYANLVRNRSRTPLKPGSAGSGQIRQQTVDRTIIHNKPSQKPSEPNSPDDSSPIDQLDYDHHLHYTFSDAHPIPTDTHDVRHRCRRHHQQPPSNIHLLDVEPYGSEVPATRKPSTELWSHNDDPLNPTTKFFNLSKQHTGMKNMSYNVLAAVAPSGGTEMAKSVPRPIPTNKAKIRQPVKSFPMYKAPANQLCESPVEVARDSAQYPDGLTGQGYFDLKFYHNKLW